MCMTGLLTFETIHLICIYQPKQKQNTVQQFFYVRNGNTIKGPRKLSMLSQVYVTKMFIIVYLVLLYALGMYVGVARLF